MNGLKIKKITARIKNLKKQVLPAAKPQNGMAHQVVFRNVKILFGNKLDLYSICKTLIQKKII